MSNPIFQAMGGQAQGPMNGLLQKFQQFRQMFQGDPNQQIRQLMNSGKITQAQYNQAVQMAQQMQKMMGGK